MYKGIWLAWGSDLRVSGSMLEFLPERVVQAESSAALRGHSEIETLTDTEVSEFFLNEIETCACRPDWLSATASSLMIQVFGGAHTRTTSSTPAV
jgi:hypothetical protein